MKRFCTLAFALFLLTGCGDPIGHDCKLRSGALGFGFDDDCKTKCLQLYKVVCPDASIVKKAVCAGSLGCDPGSCNDGEICYSFEDPIEKYFYCIPADYCGVALGDQASRAWENASRERADAIRAEFSRRMERRKTNNSTALPTAVAPTVDAPDAVVNE